LALIRRINEEDELRRWAEEDERRARTTEELRTLLVNIATVCKRFPRSVMVELMENRGLWALDHAWLRESAGTTMVRTTTKMKRRKMPPPSPPKKRESPKKGKRQAGTVLDRPDIEGSGGR